MAHTSETSEEYVIESGSTGACSADDEIRIECRMASAFSRLPRCHDRLALWMRCRALPPLKIVDAVDEEDEGLVGMSAVVIIMNNFYCCSVSSSSQLGSPFSRTECSDADEIDCFNCFIASLVCNCNSADMSLICILSTM